MKYLVTILGHARTGTNYLCGLLGSTFSNINSKYELYNSKECYINKKYLEALINHYQTKDLKKNINENPLLFLENIISISKEPIITHKIFPEHLELPIVYKIIDKSNYLLIVKRNFIDVYISYKRAINMMDKYENPWINVDTTNYKIIFNKYEYISKKKIFDNWYNNLFSYITKKKIKNII